MPALHRKFVVLLLVIVFAFSVVQPVAADGSLRVFYFGRDGNVKTALGLAGLELVGDPTLADVFVFNGMLPIP